MNAAEFRELQQAMWDHFEKVHYEQRESRLHAKYAARHKEVTDLECRQCGQ